MARTRTTQSRPGFTLFELLVVFFVLALLLALLFPAVQKVREAAQRAQCANNIRQIAHGCMGHVDQYGWYPSAGWGWSWIGCPHRGTGPEQPGGWAYNILPYIEQNNLRKLGYGQTGQTFINEMQQLVSFPVGIYNCPSRRPSKAYPNYYNYTYISVDANKATQTFVPSQAVRADYAANSGNVVEDERGPGPGTSTEGDTLSWWQSTSPYNNQPMPNGIMFLRSKVLKSDVSRGVSNVYLVGERYLDPNSYTVGDGFADNETFYCGYNNDICRTAGVRPMQDLKGLKDTFAFGSPHSGGFYMSFCDGSVRFINYTIDLAVHQASGNRFEK